jgi:hypothetical protein
MIIPSRLHAQTFNNQSKECISAYWITDGCKICEDKMDEQ